MSGLDDRGSARGWFSPVAKPGVGVKSRMDFSRVGLSRLCPAPHPATEDPGIPGSPPLRPPPAVPEATLSSSALLSGLWGLSENQTKAMEGSRHHAGHRGPAPDACRAHTWPRQPTLVPVPPSPGIHPGRLVVRDALQAPARGVHSLIKMPLFALSPRIVPQLSNQLIFNSDWKLELSASIPHTVPGPRSFLVRLQGVLQLLVEDHAPCEASPCGRAGCARAAAPCSPVSLCRTRVEPTQSPAQGAQHQVAATDLEQHIVFISMT